MRIHYTPKFHKQYYKLNSDTQNLTDIKINLFKKTPFDPKLKIHKLHGNLSEFWAFSINYEYRIIVHFIDKGQVVFRSVGKHDIYD